MGQSAQATRTPAQNTKIWSLVAEWSRESRIERADLKPLLEDICEEVSGQRHSSHLTVHQAADVIQRLQARVEAARPAAPFVHWTQQEPVRSAKETAAAKPTRRDVITPAMQKVLTAMYDMAEMHTAEHRAAFSRRQCGKPWPQSKSDADKIVEALKAIVMRKVKPADIAARVAALVGNRKLDAWKSNFIADLDAQFRAAADPAEVLTTHKLAKVLECEASI